MSYNKDLRILLFKRKPEKKEEATREVDIDDSKEVATEAEIKVDDIGSDIDLA